VCGRYLSVSDPEQLAEHFAVDEVRTAALPPRWNVAPTLDVYAVIERDGTRRLGTLRWGFVPHWTTALKGARTPINARLETVATSKMFASAFAKRRCLLPADGFYEWQAAPDGGRKQPFHLHPPSGEPLAFAGIWTAWRDPATSSDRRDAGGADRTDEQGDEQGDDRGVDPLFSAAIVTTSATGALADIHERVPVIVPRRLWRDWLTATPEEAPHLEAAVRALGPPDLVAEPITERVNSVQNEGPELLEPA
jgi:putative SOS response-associated peptidase YedK